MIVHRYWHGDARTPLGAWGSKVMRATQPRVTDWTDETLPPTVLALAESVVGVVRPEDEMRHRANIVRYALLYEHGGWWADHDLIPLARFDSLPFPATAAHRTGNRCTCWLAFPERHEVLDRALDAALHARPGARSRDASGEGLLDRLCGRDVAKVPLLIDVDGRRNDAALPWAIHLHATTR